MKARGDLNKKQKRIRQIKHRIIFTSLLSVAVIVGLIIGVVNLSKNRKQETVAVQGIPFSPIFATNPKEVRPGLTDKLTCDIITAKKVKEEKKPKIKQKDTVDPTKPMIALTFDDGPGKDTMRLLEAFEKYGVRATFFTCGTSLSRKDIPVSEILSKMDILGCDIGNHTMHHKALDKLKPKEIKAEVSGVNSIIKNYTGHSAVALRPPYGAGIRNEKVKKNSKMPMVCWSVDTEDWKTKSKKKTYKALLKQPKDGDIVLMHDIHSWTVDAVIEAIPKLLKKGYQLVTVSEMAQARGQKLEKGEYYFMFTNE